MKTVRCKKLITELHIHGVGYPPSQWNITVYVQDANRIFFAMLCFYDISETLAKGL